MKKLILTAFLGILSIPIVQAQETGKPEETEVYTPVPKVVSPGVIQKQGYFSAPSDAIILFDGSNLDSWVSSNDHHSAVEWALSENFFTVKKGSGNIETKQKFVNYQLHLEFRIPSNITGSGQARGNSGVFLASTGDNDAGYELQILDNFQNSTYVNGMVSSIYKQSIPLVNAARKPGEWQTYEVIWKAPKFNTDSSLASPAQVTVLFNGILVQNDFNLKGVTRYIGQPYYKMHGPSSIKLQAHGDKSEPISFRNIWVREL